MINSCFDVRRIEYEIEYDDNTKMCVQRELSYVNVKFSIFTISFECVVKKNYMSYEKDSIETNNYEKCHLKLIKILSKHVKIIKIYLLR